MSFAGIHGQDRAIAALVGAIVQGRVSHAYLFAGPDGVGKERVALALASALLCESGPTAEPCGHCPPCRKVQARAHPDLHFLAPENDLIPIDRVRELASRLQLTAFEGRFKIAIIAGAHRMNPAAQNALLKTLEEPPGSAVLVLLASAPHLLLPTVRSRCQILGFAPLPEAFVRERLAEATGRAGDDAEIALAATLSEGSLGRALQIAGQGLYGDRGELVETVQRLSPGAPSAALDLAAAWSEDRAKASEALEILQLWYRDRALAAAGASGEDRPPALPEIPVVAPLPLAGALGALGLLHEARRGLRGNANAQLLLERTFLALARIQGDA